MSTEAGAVADIVRAAQQHDRVDTRDLWTSVLIFPDKTITSLEKHADRPRRKRAKVAVDDGESFIRYVKNHRQPGTALYGRASLSGGAFAAVIDGHEGSEDLGADAPASEQRPAWGEHRVNYAMAQTPEWKRWIENNEKPMGQQAFAEFVEDMLGEIQKPSGIDMLQIAQSLVMKNDVTFNSATRLSNGQVQLQYVENLQQQAGPGGAMEVPTEMELALQPFIGGTRYAIKARLRTKLVNRAVQFTYLLDRPHRLVELAFKDVRDAIAKDTGLPVLLGSVESIGL